MANVGSAAERIRLHARALGFDDWATGDIAVLEADVRASTILKMSKELRSAAERGDLAEVLSNAQTIVAYLKDPRSRNT